MPVPGAPAGTQLKILVAIGSNLAVGTCLPTKATPVAGSTMLALEAEKSPARWAAVGVMAELEAGVWRRLVPWYEKKKNVRSRRIGPPIVPPYWFRFSPSCAGEKK